MSDHDNPATMRGATLVETFPRTSLTTDTDSVRVVELPAKPADTVPAREVLRPELAASYPYDLFSHQASALDALADGDSVAVATSTSSGKTHVYGLQIARRLLDAGVLTADGSRATDHNDASTALCLYPTKALTNDQKEALDDLYERLGLDVRVRIYDGDTTGNRRSIRENADVILTNFAGLNVYLEHHDRWSRFYGALDTVAIDESHTYTGIQGMHVAWILRRAKRVARYWGGDPTHVLTSATIGNPGEHSATLVGEPVTVVDDDGSPRGRRDIVLWNPPPREQTAETSTERSSGTPGPGTGATDGTTGQGTADHPGDEETDVVERVPASVEGPRVFDHLTANGVRTLLFCPSRKLTELSVQRATDHRGSKRAYDTEPALAAYNAGLGRRTRHSREHQFKTGALTGLATTSALELGIDIGSLDATVLVGYPGQRQSFWQRVGRAGREGSRSLAVLVADHRTLDQYVVDNPDYLLETDVEDAVVDTSNNSVFARHLLCAADELAVDERDLGAFADAERLRTAAEMWREAGFVDGSVEGGVHYCGPRRPQTRVNLYGNTGDDYELQLTGDSEQVPDDIDLEPVARNRAYRDYHEGAVRLQHGQQFEVVDVDDDRPQSTIDLAPVDRDYYTRTRTDVNVLDARAETQRTVNGFTLHLGRGTVLVHHHSYDRISVHSNEPEAQMLPTGNPPIRMETQLCWVEVPERVERALVQKYREYGVETGVDPAEADPPHLGYAAGLHAAEHATIQTAPLELRVDKGDLGGLATLVLDTHCARDEYEAAGDVAGESMDAATHALERRTAQLDDRTASGWFIYDGVEGGLGFARAIYENFEALARRARDQLRDCRCGRPNGCPACTFDENCGNDNQPLLRAAAVDVLDQILGESDPDALDEHLPDTEREGGRPTMFFS
jgi:DEAD/DEAH box helicase domain-containing protein